MIASQLKKIKKANNYSNSHDLDTESLYDLIPDSIKNCKYLSTASLQFDRQRLTEREEVKFNKKFRIWMKSLVVYNKDAEYKYLLDFLVRHYYVHKYNGKELLFLTLVNSNYHTKTDSFPFLNSYKKISQEYIAECCASHYDFFDFVLEYFDYYEYLRDFLDGVVECFITKNCNRMHKYKNEVKEILEKLDDRKNTSLYKKLTDSLIAKRKVQTTCKNIVENIDVHKHTYANKVGRSLLTNLGQLNEYVVWLVDNNLTDNVFTAKEFCLLTSIFTDSSFEFGDDSSFSDYTTLLGETCPKYALLKVLYRKYQQEVETYDLEIYDFYTKSSVMKKLHKHNYKSCHIKDKDVLIKCLHYNTFDPSFFKDEKIIFSNEELDVLFTKDNVFTANLIQYCNLKHIDISRYYINSIEGKDVLTQNIGKFYHDTIVDSRAVDTLILHYSKDKSIIKNIKDYAIIHRFCREYGYDEILDWHDLQFLKTLYISQKACKHNHNVDYNDIDIGSQNSQMKMSHNAQIDECNISPTLVASSCASIHSCCSTKDQHMSTKFIEYLIKRFEVADLVDVLHNEYVTLLQLINNPKWPQLKIIVKEKMQSADACRNLLNVVFDNLKRYENDLDLIYLYKPVYKCINIWKNQILAYIKQTTEDRFAKFISVLDYLITETDYEDIRIVNQISKACIDHNKTSILTLFEKYGSVMNMYIEPFVMIFDLSKYKNTLPLIKVDSNKLIKQVAKHNKIAVYNDIIIQMIQEKKELDLRPLLSLDLSTDLIYYILQYKYNNNIQGNDTEYEKLVHRLLTLDISRFLHFCRYYSQELKNKVFNDIIYNKQYNLINKQFCKFQLQDEDCIYTILDDYYCCKIQAKHVGYICSNLTNVKRFNNEILKRLDDDHKCNDIGKSNIENTLCILLCLLDNENYKPCFDSIRQEIVFLQASKSSRVRELCKQIYDKLI